MVNIQSFFQADDETVFWCSNPQYFNCITDSGKVGNDFKFWHGHNSDSSQCVEKAAPTYNQCAFTKTNQSFVGNCEQIPEKSDGDIFSMCRGKMIDKNTVKPLFCSMNTQLERNNKPSVSMDSRIVPQKLDFVDQVIQQEIGDLERTHINWNILNLDLANLLEESNEDENLTKPLQDVLHEMKRKETCCSQNEAIDSHKTTKRTNKDKVRLHEFILNMLVEGKEDCVKWSNKKEGEFEITNSIQIARLWGRAKNNPTMTYEKLARALRHYYKLDILETFQHKEKLRYKFSKNFLIKKKVLVKTN